jgi:hypothetical protein
MQEKDSEMTMLKRAIALMIFVAGLSYGATFSDDFEGWTIGSVSPWTARDQEASCLVSTSTAKPFQGAYSLKSDDFGANTKTIVYKNLGDTTTAYFRFYVYFPETFFSSFTASTHRMIFRIQASSAGAQYPYPFAISCGKDAASNSIITLDAKGFGQRMQRSTSTLTIVENTWNCVEMMFPFNAAPIATARWWLNGTEQRSLNVVLNGLANMNVCELGLTQGYEDLAYIAYAAKQIAYFDNFVMSYSYIEPITFIRPRRAQVIGR